MLAGLGSFLLGATAVPLLPVARGAEIKLRLDVARIEHWLGKGAHMSERVKHLLTTFRKQAA